MTLGNYHTYPVNCSNMPQWKQSSEKRSSDGAANPVIKKISSRILPGILTPANKDAVEWGCQSLLAYGCQKHIIVVDTNFVKVLQTLSGHKYNVNKVRWSRHMRYHDLVNPYHLKLASADTSGTVLIWDVSQASVRSTLSEPDRSLLELGWLAGGANSLLLVLYSLGTVVLWQADTATPLWRKCYAEPLVAFALDPFCDASVTFCAAYCLLTVSDLAVQQAPAGSGTKWWLALDERPRSRILTGVKSLMRASDTKACADADLAECLQLCYHWALRHHLLLLYSKKLLILDTEIHQTLGVISLERNSSPFLRCHPCARADMLFCLHESGSVSVRVRHLEPESPGELSRPSQVSYDLCCISEALRLTKQSKLLGMAVCPTSQRKVALLLADGRIIFLKLTSQKSSGERPRGLGLLTGGMLEALVPGPHLVSMCPPVTFGNWSSYRPLLAVGNVAGGVQVVDLSTGTLEKEWNLHGTPVRGIEWVSLTSFLSFAYTNLTSGKVNNEIVLTSIASGRVELVRADSNEESPICALKVSHLKQYLAILFKDQPFELWDLRSLTLLRTMPDNFPTVTALEWSPLASSKRAHWAGRRGVEPIFPETKAMPTAPTASVREQLVFTDADAQLYYFTVEGNVVRDCTRNPPEAGTASVCCIAWKSDHIVLGDADGTLTVWDLKGKVLRVLPTQRGSVRRLKFGPGKGNTKMVALFSDGLDIWDAQDVHLSVQARCPQDLPGVTDVDWAKSDKLVVSTSDGCIRIMDMELESCCTPIANLLDGGRLPFVPHLLAPKEALRLKSLVQHPEFRDRLGDTLGDRMLECVCTGPPTGTAEQSLRVASLFGDQEGILFWNVALYYLQESSTPLGSCYDWWCPNPEYKALQLERLLLHEGLRTVHCQGQRCACRLLLLGQTDRAVQLLLETDPGSEHFHTDSLWACLVASLRTEAKAQSVVKLVATNLIASGRTWDGVQLLCLIGKALDACRYLQAAGQWDDAVWLAKCTLGDAEYSQVVGRWADHLLQLQQKGKALLALVSSRQFGRCLEVLHGARMIERAALLLDACLERRLLSRGPLAENVWLDYARYLHSVGNPKASLHYCCLVGEAASDLRREIDLLDGTESRNSAGLDGHSESAAKPDH